MTIFIVKEAWRGSGKQLQSLHGCLNNLCQDAIAAQWEANLLPVALKEIATTMEVLEIATDKLFQQTQKLAIAQARVRAEYQGKLEHLARLGQDAHTSNQFKKRSVQ